MVTPSANLLSFVPVKCDEQEYSHLSAVVREHCGINLHRGKKELVRARLAGHIRKGGFGGVGDYLHHVLADSTGRRMTLMVDSLSTNLTGFFREPRHFEFLTHRFLPALIKEKLAAGHRRIRVWSAGCSTGQEPYSLAMTLLHSLGTESEQWDLKILATDISTRALDAARSGRYSRETLRDVPPVFRAMGFRPAISDVTAPGATGGVDKLTPAPAVRDLVTFRRLNLMAEWPFAGTFDFIFCRNVMIYFDHPTQQRLVQRFWNCVRPGGLLFTGHAESLTGINHKFRYVEPTIYCK